MGVLAGGLILFLLGKCCMSAAINSMFTRKRDEVELQRKFKRIAEDEDEDVYTD